MISKKNIHHINIPLIILTIVIIFYILHIGANLIIPFIIALLFSIAIIGMSNFYRKIKIFKFNLPYFISFILSIFTFIFVFWIIGKLISTSVNDLLGGGLLEQYQREIIQIILSIFQHFNIPEPTSVTQVLKEFNLSSIFQTVVSSIASIFSKVGIIFFFMIFILLEYRYVKRKINIVIKNKQKRIKFIEIFDKARSDIKSYFVIKSIVSFIVGSLSYLIMLSFGLDFAILWAFIIFLLNFIPSIGSVVAVSLPMMFALIQFDSLYTFSFLTICLVFIQVLMGNFIEPQFLGNKLNLSPLVIIVSLIFWGSIWGVIGMLLAVPLMVIINIILAKIPSTRDIAVVLSEKGDLEIDGKVKATGKKIIGKIKGKFSKKKKILKNK